MANYTFVYGRLLQRNIEHSTYFYVQLCEPNGKMYSKEKANETFWIRTKPYAFCVYNCVYNHSADNI